jgi:hypothetical protein
MSTTTQLLFASYKLECVPNKGFARKRGRRRSNTSRCFTAGSAYTPRWVISPLHRLNTLLVYLNHISLNGVRSTLSLK